MTFTLGFLPHTQIGKSLGQVQGFSKFLKTFFTILSSREWKVIIHILPPDFNISTILLMVSSNIPNSLFTSILIA